MFEVILFVSMCFAPGDCDEFEPAVWVTDKEHLEYVLNAECAVRERNYMTLPFYRESDCYVKEIEEKM